MSYVRLPIAYRSILKQCRFVTVPFGAAAPISILGYTITPKLFTESGSDYYLEYKEVEGNTVPL